MKSASVLVNICTISFSFFRIFATKTTKQYDIEV